MALTLWLTDRTRYSLGTGRCRRQRFLTNHFGPSGYGIVRKSEALPLATGQYTHRALEHLYQHLQREDALPDVGLVREAIADACAAYEARITARGFRGLFQHESTDTVVAEQQTLIAGLVWAAYRTFLPWVHREFRVVEAEVESIYVLGCTCGLSSAVLDAPAHDNKGCQGIGVMVRQDVIAERREGHGVAYLETKTTGWGSDNWAPQWETRPQLAIGTFGIPERLGKEITETYVLGLYKGSRRKGEDEAVRQDSPLCYGYCRPGNPPLSTDDWLPSYQWTDDMGRIRRASREHRKRSVKDLTVSDWPAAVAAKAAGIPAAEFWFNQLPETVLEKVAFVVGPMNPQVVQRDALKRQIHSEEVDWQNRLWSLYEAATGANWTWQHPEYQAMLDRLFPASWDCRRYGLRSECEFTDLCFQKEGWEDPLGLGRYVARRPHHESELDQAIERGCLPAEATEGDEDDD